MFRMSGSIAAIHPEVWNRGLVYETNVLRVHSAEVNTTKYNLIWILPDAY